MIPIPSDLYSFELAAHLLHHLHTEPATHQEAALLSRIVTSKLEKENNAQCEYIDNIRLTPEEKQLILQGQYCTHPNLEIQARCSEVMRYKSSRYNELSAIASDTYLQLYTLTEDATYLLRSLQVRTTLTADSPYMSQLLKAITDTSPNPFALDKVIQTLNARRIQPTWKAPIRTHIRQKMQDENQADTLNTCRGYLTNLHHLGDLTAAERDRETALTFETEADRIIAHRQPNTLYMGLSERYKNGLKLIYPHREQYPDICHRLEEKLRKQQQYISDQISTHFLQRHTISEETQAQVHAFVEGHKLQTFPEVISLLLQIRHLHQASQESLLQHIEQHPSALATSFGIAQQDSHGNTVGRESPENTPRCAAYIHNRFRTEYLLHVTLNHLFSSHVDITPEDILNMLTAIGSRHIDQNRLPLIVEGLYQGFQGDFISASHLLIPQLEHFLHDVDEAILQTDLTKLTADRQEEYTLEKILSDLTTLAPHQFDEITFFLNHGSDVNFRNKMAHGLMEPSEMTQHCPYFWWTCLYLFISIDHIIKPRNK